MKKDIVVIGASAGGIEALQALVAGLPQGFPASLFVVVHISPDSPGILAEILQRAGAVPAFMVRGRERIQRGCIYVAAPDHHLVVERGFVSASRGPKENRFRPAVDPLFRSAALAYGPRVVGIVLSGGLDDGSAGLWAVKQRRGTAIVQDPSDALVASMPLNAMRYVEADHTVPAAQMGALLLRVVNEPAQEEDPKVIPELQTEVTIAQGGEPMQAGIAGSGEPSIFACPECHGVLLKMKDGSHTRYRCHTGHAYTPQALVADYDERLQESLASAIRALQEKALLLRHLARHDELGDAEVAERLERDATDAEGRARDLHRLSMAQLPVQEGGETTG